jgi:hypothetical protein
MIYDTTLSKVHTFHRGDFKVQWEWAGEGKWGKYNDQDPSDVPLYRVSLWDRTYSYNDKIDSLRTMTPIDTSEEFINELSQRLLNLLQNNHGSARTTFARWGWETNPNILAEANER